MDDLSHNRTRSSSTQLSSLVTAWFVLWHLITFLKNSSGIHGFLSFPSKFWLLNDWQKLQFNNQLHKTLTSTWAEHVHHHLLNCAETLIHASLTPCTKAWGLLCVESNESTLQVVGISLYLSCRKTVIM